MFEIRTDDKITTMGHEVAEPEDIFNLHEWPESWTKNFPVGFPEVREDEKLTVAVMDSGICSETAENHPWFVNTEVTKRYDATGSDSTGSDLVGHGTGVASIIARATPEIEMYSLKIFSNQASTGRRTIRKAYQWLARNSSEIDLVNMSWGSSNDVPQINEYHEKIIDMGIIDVVAAGNCIPANAWILTGRGWRRMFNVYKLGEGTTIKSYDEESGEFVDDKVTKVFKREMDSEEELLRVHTEEDHVLEVTENHKILTSDGYKKAKNLSVDDEILTKPDAEYEKKAPDFYDKRTNPARKGVDFTEGCHPSGKDHVQYKERIEVECPNCEKTKKLVPWRAKTQKGFCSSECVVDYHDLTPPRLTSAEARKHMPDDLPSTGKKALEKWRENNPEKQKQLVEVQEFQENIGDGSNFPHTEEIARMGALAAHKKLQKWKNKTSIEKKVSSILDDIGINYEEEHIVKKKNGGMLTSIDFAVLERKIAVYVDGNYWHNYPNGTETDKKITDELESMGWKVIRIWGSEVNNSLKEVKGRLSKELINGAKVTKIEHIENKTVYDLSVKGNHNFVANGLVVHNSGSRGGSPSTADNAFSAGALDEDGEPTRFSSWNPDKGNPEVAAVGKDVKMARSQQSDLGKPINQDYVKASGTSFSAPYTTAAYINALYKERVNWDGRFVRGAKDIPGTEKDGAGVLKLQETLKETSAGINGHSQKSKAEASSWDFRGNDTLWIDADWLPSGDTSAELLGETKEYVDIRIEK